MVVLKTARNTSHLIPSRDSFTWSGHYSPRANGLMKCQIVSPLPQKPEKNDLKNNPLLLEQVLQMISQLSNNGVLVDS